MRLFLSAFFFCPLQKQQQHTMRTNTNRSTKATLTPITMVSCSLVKGMPALNVAGSSKVRITVFSITPPLFSATHRYFPRSSVAGLVMVRLYHRDTPSEVIFSSFKIHIWEANGSGWVLLLTILPSTTQRPWGTGLPLILHAKVASTPGAPNTRGYGISKWGLQANSAGWISSHIFPFSLEGSLQAVGLL